LSPKNFSRAFATAILKKDCATPPLDSNFNGNTLSTTDGADVTGLTYCHEPVSKSELASTPLFFLWLLRLFTANYNPCHL